MPTLSPLATLIATLTEVCHNAQQHSSLLSKNEAATRAALVDPILRALGWDTTNIGMIEPEKTVTNTWRADYALRNAASKIDLLIEAKCLGSDLEKHTTVQQLLGYAFGFGVTKLLITDGLNWHFYSEFKPGFSRAEGAISLSNDDTATCALQLIRWLDTTYFGYDLTAPPIVRESQQFHTEPVKAATQKKIILPRQAPTLISKDTSVEINKHSAKDYHKLTPDLADPDKALGKPVWLRLPDNSEHPLKTWKDILLAATHLVLQVKPDLGLPLPDKSGKKTTLLRWERPKQGLSYTETLYQNKPAFIYTNYSAADCVRNALYILKLLPKSEQLVEPSVAFTS